MTQKEALKILFFCFFLVCVIAISYGEEKSDTMQRHTFQKVSISLAKK